MPKKIFSLSAASLTLLLGLGSFTFEAQAKAKDKQSAKKPRVAQVKTKPEASMILTANEFRRLNRQDQAAYIEIWREFMVDLEKKGVSVSRGPLDQFLEKAPTNFVQSLLALVQPAHAANVWERWAPAECPQFEVSNPGPNQQICYLYYTADGGEVSDCTNSRGLFDAYAGRTLKGRDCRITMMQSLDWQKQRATNVNDTAGKALVENFTSTLPGYADRTVSQKATIYCVPGKIETDCTPWDGPVLTAPTEGVIPLQQAIDEGKVPPELLPGADRTDKAEGATTPPRINEAEARAAREREKAAEYSSMYKSGLACLYAGFAIRAAKCEAQSSYTNHSGGIYHGKTFSCVPKESITNPSAKEIITPEPISSKKPVLCNPMIFGLSKDNKPFCIAKGGSATKNCLDLATKDEETKKHALETAIQLSNEDISFARNTQLAVERLCSGKEDEQLRRSLEARGRPVEKSLADIKSTCSLYLQRLAEIKPGGTIPQVELPGTEGQQ